MDEHEYKRKMRNECREEKVEAAPVEDKCYLNFGVCLLKDV